MGDLRNLIIMALIALLWWFGAAVVRLENYRYASDMGFCTEHEWPMGMIKRHDCLMATETRTHPLWHLYYGLQRN